MMKTHQSTGVGGVWSVVFQEAWQAEVGYFAHQIAVDQDVPSCQISMDIVHVTEVFHSSCYATKHSHQLDYCELPIILL